MKTVSKEEFVQRTKKVLAAVSSHQPTIITEQGTARWRVVALDSTFDPVSCLIAAGRITPSKRTPSPWIEGPSQYTPEQIDALFAASRGNR